MELPGTTDILLQRKVLDALPAYVFVEREGRIVYVNAEARRALGMDHEEWVSCPVEEVLWGYFAGRAEPQTVLTAGEHGAPFHATLAASDGKMIPVEGTYRVLNREHHEAIIVAQPGERASKPKPKLMEDVLASLPEAVAIVHGSHVLYTNPAFSRMFGFAADEVTGDDLEDLIVPETRRHEGAMLRRLVEDQGQANIETVRMTKEGDLVDVEMQLASLLVNGEKAGDVLTFRDIGERKQMEARLVYDAMHDVLTGLPNRALFQDHLTLSLKRRARRRELSCGVLFVDLDGFKSINDTLGHAAGDMLLASVAQRLCAVLRPQDTAARLGSDEFAILVEAIVSSADLELVARRVLQQFDRPFEILGHTVHPSISIGAAMAHRDQESAELLTREADYAMYRAKQAGGNRYEVFERYGQADLQSSEHQQFDLRRFLDQSQFEIWYQPIYRLSSGQLAGFEALLRWRRADGSIATLRDLQPVLEARGLATSVFWDTVQRACRQLSVWKDLAPGNALSIAIDISERIFYSSDLPDQMRDTIAACGMDASRIVLEIPENAVNEDPDRAVAVLQRLVDCGVRLALDHFGSRLAPLNHLVRMPIHMVKVEPSLAAAANSTGRQHALLQSLIHVSKAAGLQMLAQGIDTHTQLENLRRLGCELGQGQLLSVPLDEAQARQLVSTNFGATALEA